MGKTRGKYIKGSIDEEHVLTSLASNDVSISTPAEVVNERTLISSIVATYDLKNFTAAEGPVQFGLAHSDYTAAEIEEYLENTGSWNEGSKIEQERADRKIRRVGVMTGLLTDEKHADGRPVKTKLNWILLQGQTVSIWSWNKGGGTLTSGTLVMAGHANLWPKG